MDFIGKPFAIETIERFPEVMEKVWQYINYSERVKISGK
jgi:hypothetical protein